MSAQFCKRDNTSYVVTSGRDYNWTTVSEPFILYDNKTGSGKYVSYDIYKHIYNSSGSEIQKLAIVNSAYNVTQNNSQIKFD